MGVRLEVATHRAAIRTFNAALYVTQSDGRHGLPDGDYVLVEVTDTGVGMDAATLSHAIEPFYSTRGVGKGTGLGLSMVHGLAGQSGGFLQLDSAEGRGTTATLWLPAADPDALAAPDKLEEWSQGQTGLNILLVDDEALVRQGTGAILHDLGHNVWRPMQGATLCACCVRSPSTFLSPIISCRS